MIDTSMGAQQKFAAPNPLRERSLKVLDIGPQPPLIKWAGGKRNLAAKILQRVPVKFSTYFEPFFGGGAVFFALQPPRAVLADINSDLINAYVHVRDQREALVRILKKYKNSEMDYYRIRAIDSRTQLTRAARFLYLTRLSFNGIHRVNLNGKFNVPYGHKSHLSSCDEDQLSRTSLALQGTSLVTADFEISTATARSGDVIYFDPPYTVAHAINGFVKYNERIFSWADQERLAQYARLLADRGCCVIVSNADHESIHDLYASFECEVVERPSVIAASSAYRRLTTECIFTTGGI